LVAEAAVVAVEVAEAVEVVAAEVVEVAVAVEAGEEASVLEQASNPVCHKAMHR